MQLPPPPPLRSPLTGAYSLLLPPLALPAPAAPPPPPPAHHHRQESWCCRCSLCSAKGTSAGAPACRCCGRNKMVGFSYLSCPSQQHRRGKLESTYGNKFKKRIPCEQGSAARPPCISEADFLVRTSWVVVQATHARTLTHTPEGKFHTAFNKLLHHKRADDCC